MPDNPTSPVKRTTIVVADMARSVAFYRDLLGMDLFYEGRVGNPGASAVTGIECEGLHMVVLQAHGSEIGMVGLMQVLGPRRSLEPTGWSPRLRIGESILVIPTTRLAELHARMIAAGATVVAPPVRIEVPGRGEVHEMMARDPDGMVVNLTQRGPLA